jgi:hypothetical protein
MKLVEIAMVQVLGLLRMNKTLCGQGSILARGGCELIGVIKQWATFF